MRNLSTALLLTLAPVTAFAEALTINTISPTGIPYSELDIAQVAKTMRKGGSVIVGVEICQGTTLGMVGPSLFANNTVKECYDPVLTKLRKEAKDAQ